MTDGLLGEQALLLGPLSDDAVAIRSSFIGRDDGLLSRGFMKQARKDYLNLQQTFLDNIRQRGEERRDALGLVKPLLGGEVEAVEAVARQMTSGVNNSTKEKKGKKGKKGKPVAVEAPPPSLDELPQLDTDGNIVIDEPGDQLVPESAQSEVQDGDERPSTGMTDSSPHKPNGAEGVGSPGKSGGEDSDDDSDAELFSDEDPIEVQRRKLKSQGGTVIG